MKIATLRLPESLYDDLVAEAEAEDLSFSEYARMLLRNRQANTHTSPNTPEHTQANTLDRLDELEQRVADLESLNQQDTPDDRSVLVNDDDPKDPVEVIDVDADPHGQTAQDMLQWAVEHQPVTRSEMIDEFGDAVDISGESLWTRHVRDRLKECGFTHDRSGGVATWQR
jgi:hypothetical protein